MVKLWRRYKPFINAGIQELITYRVNFILYRIGDVMGAFVAFYLWKAVFDSSQEPLIQGFSMADITLYIIMSFVTNLLTRSDSSFMIGEEVKDGSIIMRLLRPVHFAASYLFHRTWFQVVDFYLCWTAIFKCHCFDENLIWARDCRSAGTNCPLSL